MVDVGAKPVTARVARAAGRVTMSAETLRAIRDRKIAKGDVFEVARLGAMMAAKRTAELIPLCHVLPLDHVSIAFEVEDEQTLRIEATVSAQGRTGVEMEALVAATTASLVLYDMCKSIDRGMSLGPFQLLEKSGGKSGHYVRPATPPEQRSGLPLTD
jgi:cyclic pyranopterin monophosphate synthase